MDPVVDAHIRAQAQLRQRAAAVTAAAWAGLPNLNEDQVPVFLAAAVAVVVAAQRASIALVDAYTAKLLGRRPLGIRADAVLADLRAGTPPAEVYRRPFVTTWTALKNGALYEDAAAAGLARATSTAAMDVQIAQRAALTAVQATDPSIFGYQRVADADACVFCQAVDGAYVKSADAMALHNNCGCTLQPLTGAHRGAVRLPDGTRIREFQGGPLLDTPPPPEVAVHQHGELGAVLTDPAYHFTQIAA